MKILLANKFFFVNGGSETVMFQERDFLLRSGHEVVDFSMRDDRNLPSPSSAYFTEARQYRSGVGIVGKIAAAASFVHSPDAVKKISALIRDQKPDLVHCHNIYHQLTPSIIGAAERLGVPVVLTLHDYKPVCPAYLRLSQGKVCSKCLDGDFSHVLKQRCAEHSLGKSALLYAEALTQRWMGNYEKVSRFIAPSRFMGDSVSGRIDPQKISVIYNGIDLSGIEASGYDGGYALYLGRLSHEKGLPTLLQAYERHAFRLPLKVCGTGPLLEAMRSTPLRNVEFLGYQSGEALKKVIREASMVIVPSEWYENCPMSVLEAMAYRKPVVASRIGGIPELVEHEVTGRLHAPGNVDELAEIIHEVADNSQLRKRMGDAAHQRVVEKFSLEKHNEDLMRVYQEVIAG